MNITNYKQYARKTINKHLRVLVKRKEGARLATDIECVHEMRTASRRLRTAFLIFNDIFPKKKLKRWKKCLRKTASSLGEARDLDTQIIFIKEFRNKLQKSSYKPGINKLLVVLQKRRKKLQLEVVKALDELEKERTLTKIKKSIKKFSRGFKKRNIDKLYKRGREIISGKIKNLLSLESCVNQPDKIKELHEMRIAAKKLRYALESFKNLYGNRINTFIYSAWQIQTNLGRLHDFDVWIGTLPNIISESKKDKLVKSAKQVSLLQDAVTYFINNCRVFRSQTYKEFVELWERQKQVRVWRKLIRWLDR